MELYFFEIVTFLLKDAAKQGPCSLSKNVANRRELKVSFLDIIATNFNDAADSCIFTFLPRPHADVQIPQTSFTNGGR